MRDAALHRLKFPTAMKYKITKEMEDKFGRKVIVDEFKKLFPTAQSGSGPAGPASPKAGRAEYPAPASGLGDPCLRGKPHRADPCVPSGNREVQLGFRAEAIRLDDDLRQLLRDGERAALLWG